MYVGAKGSSNFSTFNPFYSFILSVLRYNYMYLLCAAKNKCRGRNASSIGYFCQTRHDRKDKRAYWPKETRIRIKQRDVKQRWAIENICLAPVPSREISFQRPTIYTCMHIFIDPFAIRCEQSRIYSDRFRPVRPDLRRSESNRINSDRFGLILFLARVEFDRESIWISLDLTRRY